MNDAYGPLSVVVFGQFACFTQPEFSAERVSYPMMTPSAARGTLEAIFWKPEFQWEIREIHVLKPRFPIAPQRDSKSFYRHFSILRNEIGKKASSNGAPISITDERQQRHSLILRDVEYLIHADVRLRPDVTDDPAKYRDQFQRRVKRGQSYHRPYLGCREFAANFEPADGNEESRRFRHEETIPLGTMLFDIAYSPLGNQPVFFDAKLDDGILNVPADLYGRLRK